MTNSETLREQVRRVIRESMDDAGSADPAVVAQLAAERFTKAQEREALAMALPNFVRVEMAHYGRSVRHSISRGGLSTADRVRNWYAKQLGVSLFVGDEWKFLRDCTADDLRTVAAERYRKAADTHAEGDRWTKVALFMEEHDRATAAQLSEDELKSLMDAS